MHNKICYGVVVLREGAWDRERGLRISHVRAVMGGACLDAKKTSKYPSTGGIEAAELCPVCWPSPRSSHRWVSFMSHPQPPSSSIRLSFLQIFYKHFVMRLAKQAGRCSYREGSDPALWIGTRIREAEDGPWLSCRLGLGSTWVKVTWAVVVTSPTRARETGNLLICMQGRCCLPAWPPQMLHAFKDYSKLVYNGQ